jgi:hypothetical protein
MKTTKPPPLPWLPAPALPRMGTMTHATAVGLARFTRDAALMLRRPVRGFSASEVRGKIVRAAVLATDPDRPPITDDDVADMLEVLAEVWHRIGGGDDYARERFVSIVQQALDLALGCAD